MRADLSRLLRPKSIAVFGGSWASAVIRQSRLMDFDGEIWPVHPDKTEVEGYPAFRSVEDLPDAPDAAFVGINRNGTIGIVKALAERGAGGAVCFASGFREAGAGDGDALRLQDDLVAAAGAMPILGPNCYGLINYCDGALLWPDQHGGVKLTAGARGVAIVTQSSNIAINMTMQARGLPIAYVVTTGNQAQIGLSDIALGLIEDERVSVLGLYIEGFNSVAGFEQLAARARQLRKPIVAMKIGRSDQARAATISHTASLTGADAAADAFLRRLGIGRVNSIAAFMETLKLLHVCGPLDGFDISSMSCSGGEASLMADSAGGRSVQFRALTPSHEKHVGTTLGALVAIANPLDYHTFIWNDQAAMTATFSAMMEGGFDLNFLVLDFPRADRCSDTDWRATVNAFERALASNRARGAIVASLPENLSEQWAADIMGRGITPMQGLDEAFAAADAAAFIGAAWKTALPAPILPSAGGPDCRRTLLNEADSKSLLAGFGLPVPRGRRVADADTAVEAADRLGYPVALKALGIAHKSESGAVLIDLHSAKEVRDACSALSGVGTEFYIERMVGNAAAELIAGVTRDPVFGSVMMLGSGGIMAELLDDTCTLLLPSTRLEIDGALRSLKLYPLLNGYRGRPKADIEAAVDAIEAIARFVVANAHWIEELDINPLIVCAEGSGASVADALIVMREETP